MRKWIHSTLNSIDPVITPRYLKRLAILTVSGIIFGQVPSIAGAAGKGGSAAIAPNVDVNGNTLIDQLGGALGSLGMVGTGVVRDTDLAWCVFNDWHARDRMKDTYHGGNINFKTTFGGTWFCVKKT